MKVHKNTLKKIKQLIEDAMDSEKTPSLEDSFTCLEQAIDKLNDLLTGNEIFNNYERIKQMSVDQMAEFIKNGTYDCNCCPANPITKKCFGCKKQIKQWLLQECE